MHRERGHRYLILSGLAGASLGLLGGAGPSLAEAKKDRCTPNPNHVDAVAVDWGRSTSIGSCFYFSGPGDLGRDDDLGARAAYLRSANRIALSFEGLLFEGELSGDQVVLERVSEHDYDGTWKVTETITATLGKTDDCVVLRGTYGYAECDTNRPVNCPGPCTISAPIEVRAIR